MPVAVDQQERLEKSILLGVWRDREHQRDKITPRDISLEITDQDFKALSHAFASLSKPAGKSAEV